jgi:ankyrin repeat protein
MIQKGAYNWNEGLWRACRGGHREIAELMIEKGGDLYLGLHGACLDGRRDMVEWMIQKGANPQNCTLSKHCH